MPEQVTRALVLLEKSLAVLPTYALAHVNAAMCHHCLFLRAGLKEENRTASLRHTEPGTKPLQISEQPTRSIVVDSAVRRNKSDMVAFPWTANLTGTSC